MLVAIVLVRLARGPLRSTGHRCAGLDHGEEATCAVVVMASERVVIVCERSMAQVNTIRQAVGWAAALPTTVLLPY